MDFRAKKRKGERREKEIEEGKFVIIYIFISIENKYFFQGMDRMDRFLRAYISHEKKKRKRREGFSWKAEFYRGTINLSREMGEEKSFLDRVEATASMQ